MSRATSTVFALLVIAFGGWLILRDAELLRDGAKARGRVVEVEKYDDGDGTEWRPIIEYTPQGASAPVRFKGLGNNPQLYRTGETVDVAYLPAEPSRARVSSALEWTKSWLVILFGVVILSSDALRRRAAAASGREAFRLARLRTRAALIVAAVGVLGTLAPLALPGALRGISIAACFGAIMAAALFSTRLRHCPDCGAHLGENGAPVFGAIPPCTACGVTLSE